MESLSRTLWGKFEFDAGSFVLCALELILFLWISTVKLIWCYKQALQGFRTSKQMFVLLLKRLEIFVQQLSLLSIALHL